MEESGNGPGTGTVVGEKAIEPRVVDVRKEWDWVKEGVDWIIKKAAHRHFRAEDVYAMCLSGEAQLWITAEGFVITTTERDELANETWCYLWLAWAKERGNGYAAEHQEFFERVAKEAGYDGLKLRTSQLSLKDYLFKRGWELETVEFTRRFNHG